MMVQVRRQQAEALLELRSEVEAAESRLNLALGVVLAGIAPEGSDIVAVTVSETCGFVEVADAPRP